MSMEHGASCVRRKCKSEMVATPDPASDVARVNLRSGALWPAVLQLQLQLHLRLEFKSETEPRSCTSSLAEAVASMEALLVTRDLVTW
uniref:HDC05064 n=1 Tax=Drosophila melanogaster TaxID=7227 RepID=Q6IGV3_DROME|nr:TPA_inf: HDC05064 [Drosophila melanogaster]